jgi:hypothetical protein
MTELMQASLAAIGCQLQTDHLPTSAKPLPRELRDLIAQLVAFEIDKRGATDRSLEALQSAIADPGPRS